MVKELERNTAVVVTVNNGDHHFPIGTEAVVVTRLPKLDEPDGAAYLLVAERTPQVLLDSEFMVKNVH